MGFDPFASVEFDMPAAGSFIDTVSSFFGNKAKEEEFKKAVSKLAKQQKAMDEKRRLALAAARSQQTLDLALAASQQRRQEQVLTLAAVGGVALLITGLFLSSALRRKGAAK